MEKQLKDIEIPFGAFDSELGGFEYTIPKGYEAEIKDGKVIVKKKDSEDERIIERIKKAVESYWSDEPLDEIVAWIEKQGEQKPTQEIEPTPIFKIGDILRRKGKDYTFRVDRIQGGYYHCDRNHGAFFPIEEQGNWELVEQKPAWSEEDEEYFDAIIAKLEVTQEDAALTNNQMEFLKSLKDRYTWKPSDLHHNLAQYINTLEVKEVLEEPISDDLEEEIIRYIGFPQEVDEDVSTTMIRKAAYHFANWQKEQLEKERKGE